MLKIVKNKFFTTSSSSKNKKLAKHKSFDDSSQPSSTLSLNTLNENTKNLSLSIVSLNEKVDSYSFILNRDPASDWIEIQATDDQNTDQSVLKPENEYSSDRAFLNISTETKSNCRIIKKFSNDCLDDYLVQIGILDDAGFKFDEHIAEIELLRQCRHKNVICFYDAYFFDFKLWSFTEYCGNGSIGKLLNDLEKPLSQIQIHYVVTEVLQGLYYLHEQIKICHHDIRADNILITSSGDIKLANFIVWAKNNSKLAKKDYFYIKSPHWIAPEIASNKLSKEDLAENFKADIWSLGITCIEMACLYPPNSSLNAESVILEISTASTPPTLNHTSLWSHNFVDFIEKCLDRNIETRPHAGNLFKHPFITGHKVNKNEMKNLLNERKFKFYDAARQTIDDLEQKLKAFKLMNQQPELYIYDYFQELRNQIDIESEKAKQYIEIVQNDMIDCLKQAESNCFSSLKKNSLDFHFPAAKVEEVEEKAELKLEDDKNLEQELTENINNWNQKLGGRNLSETLLIQTRNDAVRSKHLLEQRLDSLKSKLFLQKDYTFKLNEKIDEFPIGKLNIENNFIEKKAKFAASAANNLTNEIDFKSNTICRKLIRLELKQKRNLK